MRNPIFLLRTVGLLLLFQTLEVSAQYKIREGDEEFIVTSAAGDDIIVVNDLSADSFTFTTATEHIGARVRVRSVYMGTTLKWTAEVVGTPFGTAVGSVQTFAIGT